MTPLLMIRRRDLACLLRDTPSATAAGRRLGKSLAFVQMVVGACMILVTSAIAHQYARRQLLDLGFDYKGLAVIDLGYMPAHRKDNVGADLDALRQRLLGLSGIEAVAVSGGLPLARSGSANTRISAKQSERPRQVIRLRQSKVSENYFAVMRMPLRGRAPSFIPGQHEVAVSRSFAQHFWRDDPIGHSFTQGTIEHVITGLVVDRASDDVSGPGLPTIYYPINEDSLEYWPQVLIRSRKGQTKSLLVKKVQAAASLLEAPLVVRVQTMEELYWNVLATPRFLALVFVGLTVILIFIAAMAIFASFSREMNSRKREIAIRNALGAGRRQICLLVLAEFLWICLPATALGGALAYYSLSLTHQVLGVKSLSLLPAAAGMALALTATVLSALSPVLSASKQSPAALMRSN